MNRRQFMRSATGISGVLAAASSAPDAGAQGTARDAGAHGTARGSAAPAATQGAAPAGAAATTRVALVRTTDRAAGTARAIELLQLPAFAGRDVFVKPNFNSADPAPGSTHEDTLAALLQALQRMGAGALTLGDRSGMGDTRSVMERKGVFPLAKRFGARVVVFDELGAKAWDLVRLPDSHWQQGFALPKVVRGAGAVVQACCLKTHRYGGHFTLSLKNSVGLAAKSVPGNPHDFMRELHNSPHQRQMIAEINAAYRTDLVVLDGVEAFVTGGPDQGKRVAANVVVAGTDRVAVDAVGVALLRHHGTTPEVSRGRIFDQEQIARAVALGVGVDGPGSIELVTGDAASAAHAQEIRALLAAG